MERGPGAHCEGEKDWTRPRGMDGQFRREKVCKAGRRSKRGVEERSRRSSCSAEAERRAAREEGGSKGEKRCAPGEEKEEEGRSASQSYRRKEGPRCGLRRNRSGSRPRGPKESSKKGQEDSEERKEEEEAKLNKWKQFIGFNLFKRQRGSGGCGGVRRRKRKPPVVEAYTRCTYPCHGDGSTADVAHSARGAPGDSQDGHSSHPGPVFSGPPTAADGTGSEPRIASLVDAGGSSSTGRSSPRLRPGLSEAEKPRVLLEGGHLGHRPQLGVGAPGEDFTGEPHRDLPGRQVSKRGAEGERQDSVSRKGRRDIPGPSRGKKRQRQGRWKEGQIPCKRRKEGQRRGEREAGIRAREEQGLGKDLSQSVAQKDAGEEKSSRVVGVAGSFGSRTQGVEKVVAQKLPKGECFTPGEGRQLATADTPDPVLLGTCLPQGSSERGIHSFSSFARLMAWAWDVLQEVRERMRRQKPTAMERTCNDVSKVDIFPLATSQGLSLAVNGTISALNDLAGHSPAPSSVDQLDSPQDVQKGLGRLVERFDVWDMEATEVSFKQVFKSKTIDYAGEEIKVAQRLTWTAVSPSLPEGVGQLQLQDFCRLGTLHFVQNFEEQLLPVDAMQAPRPPSVMVEPGSWDDLVVGLVDKQVCEIWPLSNVFHCGGEPLLNGLFAVGKGEYIGTTETQRLIMNLTPLNSISRNMAGDVCTLPGLAGLSGFLLDEGQVALLSSEDIRCFFYLFAVPQAWKPFLGFNRLISPHLVPPHLQGQDCVLVSRVLPMGYVNSVSIAQHIHRNIVRWSADQMETPGGGECELRKDAGMTSSSELFRVYLDNFDQVEKLDRDTAELVKGTPSARILQLREDYQMLGLPRHPKKAVERRYRAEVQGAVVDGLQGFAMPKPAKVWQYALLGAELVGQGTASLKELQVVCGGYVYMAMFRRPLLCSLNEVWAFMQRFKGRQGRLNLPDQVKAELARFILLMPLAQMEFRASLCDQVSCSDASSLGGGLCVSTGLTDYGVAASNSQVRGDIPEPHDLIQVLTVGLFDGIAALRVAADALGLPMAGHVSVEMDPKGRRVVESWFPGSIFFDDVREVGEVHVRQLALQFSNVGLVVVGAGPPCQGVSGLNEDKKGALKDSRSSLFQEIPRIVELFKKHFVWAQVHRLMESVASMSDEDCRVMSEGVGSQPFKIDSFGLTLCHRPRLYWPTWELVSDFYPASR